MEAAAWAFASGRRQIKLYFMIGLPTETEADLEELVKLVQKILGLRSGSSGRKDNFKVTVSASTFVPNSLSHSIRVPQLPLTDIMQRLQF